MNRILLVEDDHTITEYLTAFLRTEGYAVTAVDGQQAALSALEENSFDLLLVDISLAEGNGFSLCAAVKAAYRLPVIFLTASGDEYSTVTGFDLGADDYIPKPFRPRELLSRIKNVLRLTGGVCSSVIHLGPLEIDPIRGRVTKNGTELQLSALEYRLLLVFANHRGMVLTRNQLLEAIWDAAGEFVNDNTLTVYIKRLRERIEDDPQNPAIIQTVRGRGYQAV